MKRAALGIFVILWNFPPWTHFKESKDTWVARTSASCCNLCWAMLCVFVSFVMVVGWWPPATPTPDPSFHCPDCSSSKSGAPCCDSLLGWKWNICAGCARWLGAAWPEPQRRVTARKDKIFQRSPRQSAGRTDSSGCHWYSGPRALLEYLCRQNSSAKRLCSSNLYMSLPVSAR